LRARVKKEFDGIEPAVIDQIIPTAGSTVTALLFDTSRRPYVVRLRLAERSAEFKLYLARYADAAGIPASALEAGVWISLPAHQRKEGPSPPQETAFYAESCPSISGLE
jgi:hypothetical protein